MEKVIRCISAAFIAISISLLLFANLVVVYGDTEIALRGDAREYRQVEEGMEEEIKNLLRMVDLPSGQSAKSVTNDIQEVIGSIIDGEVKAIEIAKISRFAIKYSNLAKNEIEKHSRHIAENSPLALPLYYPMDKDKIIWSINLIKFWSIAYIVCFIGAVVFGAVVFICRLTGKRFRSGYIFFIFNTAVVVFVFLIYKGLTAGAELQLRLTPAVWLALALSLPLPLKMISRRLSTRQRLKADAGGIQVKSRDIEFWECEACGAKNSKGSKFCCNCGNPFESEGCKTIYCKVCGSNVVYGSKYCPKCGAKLFE